MPSCDNCFKGVRHDGMPEGTMERIASVDCYVATPSLPFRRDTALLFLPDAFGVALRNTQLLADDFARVGFRTIVPDYFGGDPAPESALSPGSKFDGPAWIAKHDPTQTRLYLDKVISALNTDGVKTLAAIGFCFGGRYALHLAIENLVTVAVITHPTAVEVPGDFEKLLARSRAPLLINACEVDDMFPPEAQKVADRILGGGRHQPGYQRMYWAGCSHGFAVRGDINIPLVKAAKEDVFRASVDFLRRYV